MKNRCPHKDVRFCPLYVASHIPMGVGCDDGQLGIGACAVARGMNYRRQIEQLRLVDPALVARLAFLEQAMDAGKQRARNLRAAGIH